MATWTRCGTCGAATRFISSHVLQAHVPYASAFGDRTFGRLDTIAEALQSERSARWTDRARAGALPVKTYR